MNAKQIRDFYENKKDTECPLTETLIKSGYQQRRDGYILYAGQYSTLHPEDKVEVDYKKASPNQWWHLIRSWCDRSEPSAVFSRSIKCGELWFWMAEVSGVFEKKELEEIAEEALNIAVKNTTDNKMPLRTVESNMYILDKCFERICKAVEGFRK